MTAFAVDDLSISIGLGMPLGNVGSDRDVERQNEPFFSQFFIDRIQSRPHVFPELMAILSTT